MNKDIVVKLKEQAQEASDIGCMAWPETMLKAAKEIEELRKKLDNSTASDATTAAAAKEFVRKKYSSEN